MWLCDDNHEEICHEGTPRPGLPLGNSSDCPACAVIVPLELSNDKLREAIELAKDRIEQLESELEAAKAVK